MKIVILVATAKRPQMLGELLQSLERLQIDSLWDLRIIVVDNDAEQSAQQVCGRYARGVSWPVEYLVEKNAGIPFARNRALQQVGTADFVVFVDDDEVVDADWLYRLFAVQKQYDADVVVGPVRSDLPETAPAWATRGRIFSHPEYPTGSVLSWCGTNNTLVRWEVFEGVQPWFDERFALTGGSDRHFFSRVHDAGFKIVWAKDAVVSERVPLSRVSLRWVLKRMYRQGACNGFCDIDLKRVPLPKAVTAMRGLLWIVLGLVLTPFGLLLGSHKFVHYLRYVAYGLGQLGSVGGLLHREYTSIHGQ